MKEGRGHFQATLFLVCHTARDGFGGKGKKTQRVSEEIYIWEKKKPEGWVKRR